METNYNNNAGGNDMRNFWITVLIIIIISILIWVAYAEGWIGPRRTVINPVPTPGPTQIVPVGFPVPNPIPNPVPNPVPNPIPTPVPTPNPAPGTVIVSVDDMRYSPSSVTIRRGTTVRWVNNDSVSHTVTIDSGAGPSSGTMTPGEAYSYTFNSTGTFNYHCTLHTGMTGRVVVTS